ncbi:unnamed protein product [Fraxinus pennsylvanica]|uniref:Uncharacterized protein n=1 Tax=Fraxinus pennsylvanica TaxID=56036 RepID=A0AAD2E9H5_9LAMI|nr:unnamed protein product [Fraxinus pennsylvanica]
MAKPLAPTCEFFRRRDDWRKHPMMTNQWLHATLDLASLLSLPAGARADDFATFSSGSELDLLIENIFDLMLKLSHFLFAKPPICFSTAGSASEDIVLLSRSCDS